MTPRRVLIIRFSSIGDILLTFPAVAYLASQNVEVHYLTKQSFVPLVELQGQVGKVHSISNHASVAELCKAIEALRVLEFSEVFDLHRNFRSRIAVLMLKRPCRTIRKFRFKEWFLYLFRRGGFSLLGFDAISRSEEALRVVGATNSRRQMQFLKTAQTLSLQPKENLRKFACISLESAWPQKQWSACKFAELASWLHNEGYEIAWLGLKELPENTKKIPALDLTGRQTLPQAAETLAKAKFLVSNDSGLMHLAESVGTPVVAIFGPTSRELGFAPRLPESVIVEKKLWCRPCSKTGRACFRVFKRRKCLSEIEVPDVIGAIKTVEDRRKRS